jgi:OmpA-OmpF porin, OOP family
LPVLAAAVLAVASFGAMAQTSGNATPNNTMRNDTRERTSWLPGTQRGYVGLNVGRPEYGSGCGNGLFGCDDPSARAHVYTGGMFNDYLGLELGYLYEGSADRGGGRTRAEGVNLSLMLKAPLGAFNVYGKAGPLYGRARVSASPLSGIESGSRRGWGRAYAVGAGYDFTPSTGAVLEWSRNEFRFPPGGGRAEVDAVSLGLVYRF